MSAFTLTMLIDVLTMTIYIIKMIIYEPTMYIYKVIIILYEHQQESSIKQKATGITSSRFLFIQCISLYFLAMTVPLILRLTGLGSALVVTVILLVNCPMAAAL